MITLNGFDFDCITEFQNSGQDYGYADFWKNNDLIIRVYVIDFEVESEYDDYPSSFNSNTGNIGYSSYPYDVVSDVAVYTEFTDTEENVYTAEQFLENNPEINGLDKIVEQAENYTKRAFKDWWENQ